MKKQKSNFLKKPFNFIKTVFNKLLIGPIKYKRRKDYYAEKYWTDRFTKYGMSLKGSGNEGLSEKENQAFYKQIENFFIKICENENITFNSIRVLDIGCGTGYFTQIFHSKGTKEYMGLDITDVLFSKLKEKYQSFEFIKKDITTENINEKFNLIIMIDVIEHIVNEKKLDFALKNIKNCLSNDGIFIVAPIYEFNRKKLFYLKLWSKDNLKKIFIDYKIKELNFNDDYVFLVIKK